jgi:hypothetical protein
VRCLHPAAYRNGIPQHHHRNSPSSRVGCGPCVLSGEHGCGCGKFGTKRPQVQILSPRPVPQVADLRECRTLRAVSQFPAVATEASREQKGTRGNSRESRGRLRRAEEHPASQHDVADPAAQYGPSGRCDPPSTTKRQAAWSGAPPARTQCRSEVSKLVRLGTVSERHPGGGSSRPWRP